MSKHPIQPLEVDDHGTLRYKRNAIVRYLLENGGIDMNQIAALEFSQDDRDQFMQLIGYSHGNAPVSQHVSDAATSMYHGMAEHEARIQALEDRLELAREGMLEGVAGLFGVHPSFLEEGDY